MDIDAELASWITLSQIPGLGNDNIRALLQELGSPSNILSAPANSLRQFVRPAVAVSISQGINQFAVNVAREWLLDPLNNIVTLADSDYPQNLLNISSPPVLVYVKGRLDLLNHSSLAIVGSRNASAQGLRNAEAFAQAVSESDLCVVSGMAHGIDTAAHFGGLRGRGSSVAVVGTGLDKVYPAANRELAHHLACSGTLVSEFPLGTPPIATNFPRRNRIISGLSLGCLVVEASLRSGSLITARLALEQGREVFAIPGSIHSPQTKGCHTLIKQGARLVDHVNDIFEELNIFATPTNSQSNVNVPEHPLFAHLDYEPLDLDTLSLRSSLTIEALSSILLQLELDGQVASLPGGLYQRIV